jgi:hypothetical protein
VKVVQTRLGHASAVVTLNTYGHLWPGDDDLTRTVMDGAIEILADSLRTRAVVGGETCRSAAHKGAVRYSYQE